VNFNVKYLPVKYKHMKLSIWPDAVALAGTEVYKKFCDSIVTAGDTISLYDDDADAAIIWSVLWNGRMANNQKVYEHYRKQGKPVIILEVGILLRNQSWRVSVNHIDNTGIFINVMDNHRYRKFPRLSDKWHVGEDILICLQNSKSLLWSDMPATTTWLRDTVRKIKKFTDRNIVVRPHPREAVNLSEYEVEQPRYITGDIANFAQNLDRYWAVISHSSGPGVEATINGVPCFTSDKSLAYPMSRSLEQLADIENAYTPERFDWHNRMCHTEWFENEIESGIVWKYLRSNIFKTAPII
jgi:hypothetical protein